MNKMAHELGFVMDKNGNHVVEYTYDNWEDYTTACILNKFIGDVKYTPIKARGTKKTKIKHKKVYDIITSMYKKNMCQEESWSMISILEKLVTDEDDTYYYILWNLKRYFYNDDYGVSRSEIKRADESVLILTKGFENDPIKAYVRLRYFLISNSSYTQGVCEELINTYWIYAFRSSYMFRCFYLAPPASIRVPIERINIEKVCKYITIHDSSFFGSIKFIEFFQDAIRSREEQHRKEIEQLKEEHQKEIEELLAPGGTAYQVVKERFESNQNLMG